MKKDIAPYTALFPHPAVLVSCGSLESPNIITIAWASTACLDPPMVSIAVTPTRYSYNLIMETKDFVVNLPRASDVRKVDLCGSVSGKDVDKFKECSFTPEASAKVSAPRIKECPVNIECYLDKTVHLGSHDLFIGHVASVAIDKEVLMHARPDTNKLGPITYAQGVYYTLGDIIGTHGFSMGEADSE